MRKYYHFSYWLTIHSSHCHKTTHTHTHTKYVGQNIPESEDGGSLLGSSRKSLADTSVTSTADLSVFSGQRSQQAFDICIDESRSVLSEDDAENQSSPG